MRAALQHAMACCTLGTLRHIMYNWRARRSGNFFKMSTCTDADAQASAQAAAGQAAGDAAGHMRRLLHDTPSTRASRVLTRPPPESACESSTSAASAQTVPPAHPTSGRGAARPSSLRTVSTTAWRQARLLGKVVHDLCSEPQLASRHTAPHSTQPTLWIAASSS